MTVRKYVPVAAAMAALVVAGCGGGSDPAPTPTPPPPPPEPVALELPANSGLIATDDDPIMVEPGKSVRRGNVMFSCPAGDDACVVNVMNVPGDADARAATYEATGGKVTVAPAMEALEVPANHGLTEPITVAAGKTMPHGNVDVSCPAGGAACMVSVTGGDAFRAATGGEPTVAIGSDALALPFGHGLSSMTIAAGDTHRGPRGVSLMCRAGGADCVVSVAEDGGVRYDATGGRLAEPIINEMILAANSGPNRDHAMASDGGHAVGLVTRLGTSLAAPVISPATTSRTESTTIIRGGATSDTTGTIVSPGATSNVPNRGGTLLDAATRNGDIVQSTMRGVPNVNAMARWTTNAAPTLSLTLDGGAFVGQSGLLSIDTVDRGSQAASLGTGWNGAVMKAGAAGGTTAYAAVYSDIEKGEPKADDGLETDDVFELPLSLNFGADLDRTPTLEFNVDFDRTGTDGTEKIYFRLVDQGRRQWDRGIARGATLPVRVTRIGSRVIDPENQRANIVCAAQVECVVRQVGAGATQSAMFGEWRLRTDIDTSTPAKVDKHYLTLGYWLALPEIADGAFDVGAFANGSVPYTRAELNALTGEARYRGPATGIYGRGVYGNPTGSQAGRGQDPVVTSAQVGSFIATADLSARFGAAGDAPRITGTVANFTENGASLGAWLVALGWARPADAAAVLLRGVTSGAADGRQLTGQWGAEFFKSGAETTANPRPGYAAGTFTASTVDENTPQDINALHIIGAFGAERR